MDYNEVQSFWQEIQMQHLRKKNSKLIRSLQNTHRESTE